jgi:hypothetical protein
MSAISGDDLDVLWKYWLLINNKTLGKTSLSMPTIMPQPKMPI